MRAVLTLVAVIAMIAFVGISIADSTICPFDATPVPQGLITSSSSTAGSCVGIMVVSESYTYQDVPHPILTTEVVNVTDENGNVTGTENILVTSNFTGTINQNGYAFNAQSMGGATSYASQSMVGSAFQTIKITNQKGGVLDQSEQYAQSSYNIGDNMTWNDVVIGGSSGIISSGMITTQTNIVSPIDVSYSAIFANDDGTADIGTGIVYHSSLLQEGVNTTMYASTTASDYTRYEGVFTLASDYKMSMIHPFSSGINPSVAAIKLCA
jgi:hypothetical protein